MYFFVIFAFSLCGVLGDKIKLRIVGSPLVQQAIINTFLVLTAYRIERQYYVELKPTL